MTRCHTWMQRAEAAMRRIPSTWIASLARFCLATTFWQSGQSKIEGWAVSWVSFEWQWGWPRLAESTVPLFRDEYRLPLFDPHGLAVLTATAEHVLPFLLLLGLFTRWAALALLGMTLVIQLWVYPGAFMVHGLWAVALLYLMVHGPGCVSVDAWLRQRSRVADQAIRR